MLYTSPLNVASLKHGKICRLTTKACFYDVADDDWTHCLMNWPQDDFWAAGTAPASSSGMLRMYNQGKKDLCLSGWWYNGWTKPVTFCIFKWTPRMRSFSGAWKLALLHNRVPWQPVGKVWIDLPSLNADRLFQPPSSFFFSFLSLFFSSLSLGKPFAALSWLTLSSS
jgi:hypothetical protein